MNTTSTYKGFKLSLNQAYLVNALENGATLEVSKRFNEYGKYYKTRMGQRVRVHSATIDALRRLGVLKVGVSHDLYTTFVLA